MFKARYCKAIVTCSKHTAHDFVSYFPKYPRRNIHVIYLDGEVKESDDMTWEEKMPKDYKERGYFIYMGGALSKSKNSEGVIRGYRNFIGRVGNSKRVPYLVIAGKNFTKDVDSKVVCFKNKVKDLGIKENVTFFGFYEDTQVKPLLNNSIAFIHLSLYEGFGISLVEALKSKAPVIAHNGTCYPEVLGDGGLLVNGMDEKDVGKAMYKLYTDNKLREELIEKGTQRGKLFSWDIAVRKTIEVFKEVSSNISIYTK
jgi:glycosyltransferase involved in cell wall biosynthesis